MLPHLLQERAVCRLEAGTTLHQLLTIFVPPSRFAGAMPGTCRTPTKPQNPGALPCHPRHHVFGGDMLQFMCDS